MAKAPSRFHRFSINVIHLKGGSGGGGGGGGVVAGGGGTVVNAVRVGDGVGLNSGGGGGVCARKEDEKCGVGLQGSR